MIIYLTDSAHPRVELCAEVLVTRVYEQVGSPLVHSGDFVRATISFALCYLTSNMHFSSRDTVKIMA